jgi:iron complex transport system ATP-binding protein
MSAILAASGLTVTRGAQAVVKDVALALQPGTFTALVGPNGAGKSTLVAALAGLIPATGTLTLEGSPLASLPATARARRIAYLPQTRDVAWPISVAGLVGLGRLPFADRFRPLGPDDHRAVRDALAALDLMAFAHRPVTELSGGEQARVMLARALATGAPVLLADEPTVGLDPRHQLAVMDHLRRAAASGVAVLAVLHDLTLAARLTDRVVLMAQGRVVADGPPAAVLNPQALADTFGVGVRMVEGESGPVPLPWTAL